MADRFEKFLEEVFGSAEDLERNFQERKAEWEKMEREAKALSRSKHLTASEKRFIENQQKTVREAQRVRQSLIESTRSLMEDSDFD